MRCLTRFGRLLVLLEADSATHKGVLSLFDLHFVKTKLFDKAESQIAHTAFDVRQDNDYEDFYRPSFEEASSQLTEVKQFLAKVEDCRKRLIAGEIPLPNAPTNSKKTKHYERP